MKIPTKLAQIMVTGSMVAVVGVYSIGIIIAAVVVIIYDDLKGTKPCS